jgi:hypothetical protein
MLRKMNVEKKKSGEKDECWNPIVLGNVVGFFLSWEKGSVCFWRRRGLDWIRV